MRKIICVLLAVSVVLCLEAQDQKRISSAPAKMVQTGVLNSLTETRCLGLYNQPSADLKWKPVLQKADAENDMPNDEKLEALKNENDKWKQQFERQNNGTNAEQVSRSVTPVVGVNYSGNIFNGHYPPDNSIAISNGGYIVATANSTIEYDDTDGNNIYFKGLEGANGFFADASLDDICDASVVYDAGDDRFIMVTQTCHGTAASSKVIVSFSKSNNPMDGWYVYKFNGDVLNDGSWFDYPRIGTSNNELYIAGNTYFNSGSFNQVVLFQMTKSVGYAGTTFSYPASSVVWSNITDAKGNNAYTLVPAQAGQQSNYGPGIYLVSTENHGGSALTLYNLTDDLTNNPTINVYSIPTTAYAVGSNAYQKGDTSKLDLGDSRMFNAFYLNGIVHCVFHSRDPNNPYSDINYNRIDVATHTGQSSLLGLTGYDYAYPSLASYASNTADKSVMIAFVRSGASIYPETRVVNCDDNMNWSGTTLVQAGKGAIVRCFDSKRGAQRWGDYTRIIRKHSSPTPDVWMTGHYASTDSLWATWIAEIHDVSPTAVANVPQNINAMKIYPNPARGIFKLEFTVPSNSDINIKVTDPEGRSIKELFNGYVEAGQNILSFDKSNIPAGAYFLLIRAKDNVLRNEKFVIAN